MMPGLLPTSLSLSATPSTSRASERRAFSKPFHERIHIEEASAGPPAHPYGVKAARLFPMPALQPMRVQSRLNPVTEIAKVGVCADRRTGSGRMLSDCNSSGSDHDPSSVCLVAMVNEFIESDSACSEGGNSCNFLDEPTSTNGLADISKSLQSLACCRDDLESKLLRDVQSIMESLEEDHRAHADASCQKRKVMNSLQRIGYDAAVCKTRWDHTSDLPGGDYEYIDVLFALDAPSHHLRLLVDTEFQAQFEIARPLSDFSAVLQRVPPIFVGRSDRLQQIVHLMADATKQSLCIKGLHLPPWRKLNYLKSKWFSLYKRTSNNIANNSCKQDNDSMSGGGFAGIAVRGYGLDPRCTNELELLYHGSKRPTRNAKDTIPCSSARDELITVTTTNWQPPPLEYRFHSNTRSQSNVTGLASMLRHTNVPTCNEVVANAA